ncbi:hypothetical protein Xen7305DRAFT_00018440 [Xenococcus sp. PCC 7305]|uniref:hypothetical protein n=1 Tax=Xenococcus sp. PCC 7305 TaxID=102125 RepID=UPI0002AC632A|nr:hypothetical protein [Xenococcus sp. PCC 7305]ELS02133.1 hypothetical protein Xen7305DRAFT_00018440 [Xenococcus sp. PCC 7305]
MNLDQQLQILIKNAPNYGVPALVIEKAIAPVLRKFAEQLKFSEYYILQNPTEDWVMFKVKDNPQQDSEKTVIYAFTSHQDAIQFNRKQDDGIVANPLPTTHILFRLFSVKQINSIVFFNKVEKMEQGIELQRKDLQNLIQEQLQKLAKTKANNIA